MELNASQQIFMLFFAIFWGAIANVQPRWKAFQFPLMCRCPHVCYRVLLAILLFNLVPIFYFGWMLSVLHDMVVAGCSIHSGMVWFGVKSIVPAFAAFGFYRFWICIIEFRGRWFYKVNPCDVPREYRHAEPTLILHLDDWIGRDPRAPVIEVAEAAAKGNFIAAIVYFVISAYSPWVAARIESVSCNVWGW